MTPILSTKSNNLKLLKPLLKKSKIEKSYSFNFISWKNDKENVLKNIAKIFKNEKIVVRSSAIKEDSKDKSLAGCFKSFLNVNPVEKDKLEDLIKQVFCSYKKKGEEDSLNQVLIQSQAKEIIISGVIFTHTLEKGAPYYIINYEMNGNTDGVTKGIEGKTIKISRFAHKKNIKVIWNKLLDSIKEIEKILDNSFLDIEFGINNKKEIIIFQVRPLTIQPKNIDVVVKTNILKLKKKFKKLSHKNHLLGNHTIFADMPDWNPAELIGDNPNYLDYSLFREIITEEIWNKARSSQGYRNVSPASLVCLFGNKPYVNARSSFNSFIPATIPDKIAEKLVKFYLKKLELKPELQDKVEFEIVYSCFDFTFDERSKELLNEQFQKEEIKVLREKLIELTNNLIINSKKTILDELNALNEMKNNREKIIIPSEREDHEMAALDCAKKLLDDCKENGTLQFSRLARLAFIGKIILKSMVVKGIISLEFYENYMQSINTVASDFKKDFILYERGKISLEKFSKRYYHLRPGTYDITQERYGSNLNLIGLKIKRINEKKKNTIKINSKNISKINKVLKENGLLFDARELLSFIKKAIEVRELSKFEFTKNLSDAIELIAISGGELGFSRNELSFLDVKDILKNYNNKEELTNEWIKKILSRKSDRKKNEMLELPPIIFSEKDLEVIQYYSPKPNFITKNKIKAKVVDIQKSPLNLRNKIVLIESGDPGYDWIFTRGIAGLITKYGGVASHMSIRCAEFGLPAAIGCGELYEKIKSFDEISLDCNLKKITPY